MVYRAKLGGLHTWAPKYYCLWLGCGPWTVFAPFYANIIFVVIKLKQECRLRNNDFPTQYFETNLFLILKRPVYGIKQATFF